MRVWLLTPLLLVAALAAGCGEDQEQPQALPSVAVTTATTAPSPTSAPVPTEAQAETPQGAAAFARFFYAEVQRAFAEKDPVIVERLSAPDCETCDLFVNSLTKLRDNNESASSVRYDIKAAESPAVEGDKVIVTVLYDGPAVQRFDAAGAVISEEPAVVDAQEQMVLVRGAEGWLVSEIQAV